MNEQHEINISRGTYSLMKKTRGKNPNTLYFGYDANNEVMAGIFLGDHELTSHIKNIQLVPTVDGEASILSVTYIDADNKINNVQTKIISDAYIPGILQFLNITLPALQERINNIETSVTNIQSRIEWLNLDKN